MDQHQQLIGSRHHFLTLSSTDYPYREDSRIQYLWETNNWWGIKLHVHGAWNNHLKHTNDRFLMDGIVAVIKNPSHLKCINDVRLFLKVALLSDLSTPDRFSFHEWSWSPPPLRKTHEKWPNRRTPLPENWRLWQNALRLAYYGASSIHPYHIIPSLPLI